MTLHTIRNASGVQGPHMVTGGWMERWRHPPIMRRRPVSIRDHMEPMEGVPTASPREPPTTPSPLAIKIIAIGVRKTRATSSYVETSANWGFVAGMENVSPDGGPWSHGSGVSIWRFQRFLM